jgi:5-methylcytosine-specific restriction endonuclease McrA
VDDFITSHCEKMIDEDIVKALRKMGYNDANIWTVKYRRRKLGIKKYLYGEIKKHKAWVRTQAIKRYGKKCELCHYSLTIDTHHIIPKHRGGPHEIENLMIICPNCHALITRGVLILKKRTDIPIVRKEIRKLLTSTS